MPYTIRYTNPRCPDLFDRFNIQRLRIEANSAEQALENSGLIECDMEIVGVDEDNTDELQRDAAWLDSAVVDAIPNRDNELDAWLDPQKIDEAKKHIAERNANNARRAELASMTIADMKALADEYADADATRADLLAGL